MSTKFIVQVVLIITSIVIIMTFVRPMFGQIAATQAEVTRYQTAVAQAGEINSVLQGLVAEEQRLAGSELQRLETYLPTEIDPVVVMRDIEAMFAAADVTITRLEIGAEGIEIEEAAYPYTLEATVDRAGTGLADTERAPALTRQPFTVRFTAAYEDLKEILASMEANAYPLEVQLLEFGDGGAFDSQNGAEETELPVGTYRFILVVTATAYGGNY